jgi:DNA-binding transcriptional regulator YiaG
MPRRSSAQIQSGKSRVNWDKVRATSDEEIERQRQADDEDVPANDDGLIVVSAAYVRYIRDKLGLTQFQFADQFGLNRLTVQEWERCRKVSKVNT